MTAARRNRSAFSFGDNAGPIIAAAIGGAAIGFAANYGRKFLMQSMEAAAGDWDEILATEHDLALGIFDKMLATDQTQTFKRKMLLMKLTNALDKHAHQEEMVVYPALREANEAGDADTLEVEHGHVKTYLYELGEMAPDAPNWLEKVREFRDAVKSTPTWKKRKCSRASRPSWMRSRTRASPASSTATASGWRSSTDGLCRIPIVHARQNRIDGPSTAAKPSVTRRLQDRKSMSFARSRNPAGRRRAERKSRC